MDKKLWGVLTEKHGCKLSGEDCTHRKCRRYLTCKGMVTAILKLFEEEMLRLIGEDEEGRIEWYSPKGEVRGCTKEELARNQLRAELRNALNTEGER
jgi:hypothetical protein